MTFVFVDPNKEPIGLNLVAKGQEGSPTEIQCIIRITSDDQMQLRMAGGGRFARRPSEFPKGASLDTLVLNRLK